MNPFSFPDFFGDWHLKKEKQKAVSSYEHPIFIVTYEILERAVNPVYLPINLVNIRLPLKVARLSGGNFRGH